VTYVCDTLRRANGWGSMQKMTLGLVTAVLLAAIGFLTVPSTSAQASNNCPAGFTVTQTGVNDPEDVNLDRYVCEQRIAQSDTLVSTFKVDNSGYPCPGSSNGTPLEPNGPFVLVFNPPGVRPDRNCNALACAKAFFTRSGGFHQVLIDDKGPAGVCP
jgi:hypothetical protein